jgi:predicted RNA-binding Zn ribbon-like protein
MPEAIDVPVGRWVRYSRYEIRGEHICPAANATIEEYDPWSDYRAATATRDAQPPYQELLELVRNFRRFAHAEDNARIAAWCAKHGPLGVLLQCAAQATFPRRMERVLEDGHWLDESAKRPLLAATVHRFTQTGYSWRDHQSIMFPWMSDEGEWREAPDPPPGVLWNDLREGTWQTLSIEKGWAPFFPNVPAKERATYPYPVPWSQEFWAQYAEPILSFIDAATFFTEAVALLMDAPAWEGPTADQRQDALARAHWLNALMAPASAVLTPDSDGNWRQHWRAPSLLSAYALMATQDLSGQRRVRACAACGKLFVSAAYQARYCSEACRNRQQQRAHRARQRGGSE